jgi:hypothetical protein
LNAQLPSATEIVRTAEQASAKHPNSRSAGGRQIDESDEQATNAAV